MRCSGVKKYKSRVAIDKERTRHDGCTGWNFKNLCEVYAPCLNCSFLLLVCLTCTLALIDASWLSARLSEVAGSSTVVTGILSELCWRRSRSSGVPLGLRWPIVLRPLNILGLARSRHQLSSWWLVRRPGGYWVSHSGALRSTARKSNCDFGLSLLQVMQAEVFFHCYGIINHLIEALETSAQTGPQLWGHSL